MYWLYWVVFTTNTTKYNPTSLRARVQPNSNKMTKPSNSLQHPAGLTTIAKAKRYPSVPEHCIPKSKFSDKSANGLTAAILTWLELHGHYASRIQSQGQYNPTLKRWTRSTVKRGIGDITAIVNGRTVMIEIKMKDSQSPWQKKTQQEVERSGGSYWLCHSFDEFVTFYNTLTTQ